MNLLLTGGTGFLGKNLMRHLLDQGLYQKVYVLIRPSVKENVEERFQKILEEIFEPSLRAGAIEKFIPVAGDFVKPKLGLSPELYQMIALDIDQVLHNGASTDFGAPLDTSRKFNVDGTRNMLELARVAKQGGKEVRFDYVSTAFVAGIKKGVVTEENLFRDQEFANNYEQTKWEAECLVQEFGREIPTYVYRPSIVVGDSRTGYTPDFRVLYWPLRLLSKNILPFVPSNPRANLDVVPVDFVAECITSLMTRKDLPMRVFHLTSGMGNEVRLGKLYVDAAKIAQIKRRPMIPMWLFDLLRSSYGKKIMSKDFWHTCEMAKPYYYYLKGTGVTFDSSKSQNVLMQLGIRTPVWDEYKKSILRFCVESRWGKRLGKPVYNYYQV